MFQSSQNIILISFEQATLTNVLKCIYDYIYSTTNKDVPVDFYLDGEIEKVESLNEIKTEGLKIMVKCRETNIAKSLYYYGVTYGDIGKLQPYISEIVKQPKNNQSTCLVYCFNYNNLLQGYGSFEKVQENDSTFLKFQLAEFMYKNSQVRSYNLVYFPEDIKNDKIEWLYNQVSERNKHLNGRHLSTFFSENNKHLEQFHHFLKLPTYLVSNNDFIPKIPF